MNHLVRMGLAAMLCMYGHNALSAAAAAGAGAGATQARTPQVIPKAIPSVDANGLIQIGIFLFTLPAQEQEKYKVQLTEYFNGLALSLSNYLSSDPFKDPKISLTSLLAPIHNLESLLNAIMPPGSPYLQTRKLAIPTVSSSTGKVDISHHISNRSLLLDLLATAQTPVVIPAAPAQPATGAPKAGGK